MSVIVTQPGKLLQCAIPSSRTAQQWQQAWGRAVLLPETARTPDPMEGVRTTQGPVGSQPRSLLLDEVSLNGYYSDCRALFNPDLFSFVQ